MPKTDEFYERKIRFPKDLWKRVEEAFTNRFKYTDGSKAQFVRRVVLDFITDTVGWYEINNATTAARESAREKIQKDFSIKI